MYDGLGNLALLAAIGAELLARAVGWRRAARLVLASVGITIVAQIPLRANGVERIVGPYRRGYEWMASLRADAVVFPSDQVMWGRQLLRNDPFLRDVPKIFNADQLPRNFVDSMKARHVSVHVVTKPELERQHLPIRIMAIGHIIIGK